MDTGKSDGLRRIGSVKAAINMYGEKIFDTKPALAIAKNSQPDSPESNPITKELHLARRDINRFSEKRRAAESVKAKAELELNDARKTVKDLTSVLEDSSLKVKAQIRDLEKLKKQGRGDEEWEVAGVKTENYQYTEVMKELEVIKQELSKLKLDMASVIEEKSRAEKEIEVSSSKMWSYSNSADTIRKEIEEVNEEQVLVELARIEAQKEYGAIESQKKEEANQFKSQIEKTQQKMKEIIQEIDHSKELETKLADTMSDIDVLQNDLNLVKVTGEKVYESSRFQKEELENQILLQKVTEELEAAKQELASVKEEGFQFMGSMDIVREELRHVREEISILKITEHKADLTIQNLNLKLLSARSRLELASTAEEKSKGVVSNLTLNLQQLQTEAEAARKEKELIKEETISINEEIHKTENDIDLIEERLQAAMEEIETVKSSETITLNKLKLLTAETMKARASASQHSSMITISNFEYEYLTGHAAGAEEIADKKVAAAQAWIEALKASEKEILMKTELAQREVREIGLEVEKEAHGADKSLSAKKVVEGELQNWRRKREKSSENNENMQLTIAQQLPRKSFKDNGNSTPARRSTRPRRPSTPGILYMPRSTSFRKKKKVIPDLSKLFNGKEKS